MTDAQSPASFTRLLRQVLPVLALGVAAFAGAGAATCAYHALSPAPQPSTAPVELRGTSSVVRAVRDLALLEAVSYHMERVIDLRQRQTRLLGLVQGDDAVLLIAAADVVAGIDLAELRENDMQVDAVTRSAHVLLPPPRIIATRLDNEHTYVYSRTTDTLATREENLETRARQEAERVLREAALDAGILLRARESVRRSVAGLVSSLGFERVEVTFRTE